MKPSVKPITTRWADSNAFNTTVNRSMYGTCYYHYSRPGGTGKTPRTLCKKHTIFFRQSKKKKNTWLLFRCTPTYVIPRFFSGKSQTSLTKTSECSTHRSRTRERLHVTSNFAKTCIRKTNVQNRVN